LNTKNGFQVEDEKNIQEMFFFPPRDRDMVLSLATGEVKR
jgi:hypothetical protein